MRLERLTSSRPGRANGSEDALWFSQYWINPQQYVYFVTTSTLDSLGGNGLVNSGSAFDIAAITNSNRKIYQVGFSFYDSYKGQWYSTTINIPSAYQVPLTAWQLNIVGQNGGAYVQFIYPTSGGITYSAYNSLTYGTLLSIGCYQSPLLQTAETSNMIYGTPTVSGGQITQSYVY